MAKSSGLGANCYVQGYDLTNDIGQIDALENGRGLLGVTGLDKSGHERLQGLQTGRIAFTGFFNDAALQEHVALKLIPTTDVIGTVFKTAALAAVAASLIGKRTNYPVTRAADGAMGTGTEIQSNADQLNYGLALTAGKRTDVAATNGTGVDFGTGSTTFGLVAYLHVFAFTGTSVTVTIQESSNDGAGDPYAAVTGGAFTAATGITAQRIETSLTQTVERYLRAVTTGTFSSAQFAVMAKRYTSAGAEK
jgi:hypothetical protein